MAKNIKDQNKRLKEIAKHVGQDHKGLEDPNVSKGTKVIDHMVELKKMLSLISVVPMDSHYKEIMRIRLTHTKEESTMILMKYATKHGVRWKMLLDLEQEAVQKVKDYLKKTSIDDAVGQFGSDRSLQNKTVEAIGQSPGILGGSGKGINHE